MKATFIDNRFGCGTKVSVRFAKYQDNGRTAIQLVDEETGEPWLTASVNFPECPELDNPAYVAIKDWSENEGVARLLQEAGVLAERVGSVPSGHVVAPIHRLSNEALLMI